MKEISQSIIDQVRSLQSSRERYVLELRLGIDSDHPYTLQEIADKLQVSRERVRQIQHRGLSKLRNPEINSILLSTELSSSLKGSGRFSKKSVSKNSNASLRIDKNSQPNKNDEYIVITFKEAVLGKDPIDGTKFLSNRHKVSAEWARQDGLETLFITNGEIVAKWPTRIIDLITWPNGAEIPTTPREFADRMAEIKLKYPKAWSKWSWEEEQQLIAFFNSGYSVKEIAEKMGRAPGGIFSRLKKIEIIGEDTEFNESLTISQNNKIIESAPPLIGSVYQLVETLYSKQIKPSSNSKLDKRFNEYGWFLPTDKLFRCPDCQKNRVIVFRKHWRNLGRIFHRWAIVCIECDKIGESRDFGNDLIEAIHETFDGLQPIENDCPDCKSL